MKMKYFSLAIIILAFQSCNSESKKVHQHENISLQHKHDHSPILIDSIPTTSKDIEKLEFKKYKIDTATIYINPNYDINYINKNLDNFAITSDGILFDRTDVAIFFYKGKYGCLNNLISLDTISCDKIDKYVVLNKIAFHEGNSHIRKPNSNHYWKMTKIQYSSLLDTIKKWNFEDKTVNLKMETAPTGSLSCNGNNKVYLYDEIEIVPNDYKH